jgi:two-component system, chemotaxis family, protein-glutamate methylesterase/glutaminase
LNASRRHPAPPARRVDAIVVGTSAGGVEALSVLLPTLPPDFAPPLLIVLHLPRDRPSLLVEVYSHRCRLPVREAADKEPIRSGCIYFAPPDYHLLVDRDADGPSLALSMDPPVHFSRPAIDVLFESAADVYRSRLGGVILTGANADGAAGLVAVKAAGGATLVQDPATAKSPAMPRAALALAGPVDFVLSLEQMPAVLRAWGGRGAN